MSLTTSVQIIPDKEKYTQTLNSNKGPDDVPLMLQNSNAVPDVPNSETESLRPFYFVKHGIGQNYWNLPKPSTQGEDLENWMDDGNSYEVPWRTVNQTLKLEMTSSEMIGYLFFYLNS